MISMRNITRGATAAIGLSIATFAVGGGQTSAAAPCAIIDADVESGTAMFTVGPADCTGVVGPISFSTYALPTGQIQPYEDQRLIAHADQNGRSYGAGTYTLTAPLGEALNWQADLYLGGSIDQPPQPKTVAVDAQTGVTSVTETTIASQPSVVGPTGSPVEAFVPAPSEQQQGGSLPLTGSAPARLLVIAAGMTAAGFAIKRLSRIPNASS